MDESGAGAVKKGRDGIFGGEVVVVVCEVVMLSWRGVWGAKVLVERVEVELEGVDKVLVQVGELVLAEDAGNMDEGGGGERSPSPSSGPTGGGRGVVDGGKRGERET